MRGRFGIFLAEEVALTARVNTVLLDENRPYQTVMGNLLQEDMAVQRYPPISTSTNK